MLPVRVPVVIVPAMCPPLKVIDEAPAVVVSVGAVGLEAFGQLAPSFGELIAVPAAVKACTINVAAGVVAGDANAAAAAAAVISKRSAPVLLNI